jgi:cytochrome c oxidase subunit 2
LAPEPSTSRRRLFAAVLLAAAVALLVLAPSALADYFTPESGGGSRNAEDIDTLYKWVLAVAVVVFVGVEGALLYSLLRFRKRRRGQVAAQIRGNTSLEIGWTVGAALVLVVITVVTFIMLPGIKNPARSGPGGVAGTGALFATIDQPNPPDGKGLTILVNGQQYVWRFTYPNRAYSYETMVVPTHTTVVLKLHAQDVIHSWWIPKLGGKMDAVPGYENKTWFKVTKEGVYRGQCAELCGRGHAEMLATVTAVSPTRYEQWINAQKRLIDQANRDATQQRRTLSPIPQ